MAALDADERGDLALFANSQDIVDRVGHLEGIRIRADHSVNDVDLLQRLADGCAILHRLRGDPRRPELRADATLPKSGDIRMKVFLRLRDVDPLKGQILLFSKLPRKIIVPVDQDGFAVNAERLVGNLHRLARLEIDAGL